MAIITGTAGNDVLLGTASADTFVVNFGTRTVAGATTSFNSWLAQNNLPLPSAGSAALQFAANYSTWVASMASTYALGADLNGDGVVSTSIVPVRAGGGFAVEPWIEGTTQAQRDALFNGGSMVEMSLGGFDFNVTFDTTLTVPGATVLTGPGNDIIRGFSRAEGDKLAVTGLQLSDIAHFNVQERDADADGRLDTVFTLDTDPAWSLVLSGFTGFNPLLDIGAAPGAGGPVPAGVLLQGTAGNDVLVGTAGNDTLVGGPGADTLTGAAGADRFVVDFGVRTIPGGSSTFAGWLAANGHAALRDGVTTQSEFSNAYGDWLRSLVEDFGIGADVNGDGVVSVGLNQNDGDRDATPHIEGLGERELDAMFGARTDIDVVTGNHTQERFYSNTFSVEARTVFTGSGRDVITDFNAAEGDRLVVSGVTGAQLGDFRVHRADIDADGRLDTVVKLESDPSWSLKLMGVASLNPATDVVLAGS